MRAQQEEENVDVDAVLDNLREKVGTHQDEVMAVEVPEVACEIAYVAPPPVQSVPAPVAPTSDASVPVASAAERSQPATRKPRPSNLAVWIATVPALALLAFLLTGLFTGRFKLNRKGLEQIGVPPEQAEKLAGTKIEPPPEKSTTVIEVVPKPPEPGPPDAGPSAPVESIRPRVSQPHSQPPADTSTAPPQPAPDRPTPPETTKPTASVAASSTPQQPSMSTRPPKPTRPFVPSAATLSEKIAMVREIYQDSYQAAQTRSDRTEVAEQILASARETLDDPDGRYALFRVAIDMFRRDEEFLRAMSTIDEMTRLYEDFDGIERGLEVLQSSKTPIRRRSGFSSAAVQLAKNCLATGRVEEGRSACAILRDNVETIPTSSLGDLLKVEKQLQDAWRLFERYEKSALVLEQNPLNPAAQFDAGKFFCIVEDRWSEGLPRLAQGSDTLYREAALKDLDSKLGAFSRAEGWYDVLKQASTSLERERITRRAVAFYQLAKPDARGLEARMIDRRLEELEGSPTPKTTKPGTTPAAEKSRKKQVRVLATMQYDSPSHSGDFARIQGYVMQVGMGPSSSGLGEAAAGVELENAGVIQAVCTASHPSLSRLSSMTKAGFFVDYHGPAGYSKRVFLDAAKTSPRSFTAQPAWGAAKYPDDKVTLPGSNVYTIALEKWAPADWDGRCWFSVYMMSGGKDRIFNAKLSWTPRPETGKDD